MFATAVVYARVPGDDIASRLAGTPDEGAIDDVGVTLPPAADRSPDLGGAEFALARAQCGNTVDSEGTATRIGGDLYRCPSCETRFAEKYEQLQRGG